MKPQKVGVWSDLGEAVFSLTFVVVLLPNYLKINSLVINDSVNNPFDASCPSTANLSQGHTHLAGFAFGPRHNGIGETDGDCDPVNLPWPFSDSAPVVA
jgi:hypothetical protein